jgi:release factor glutamine methyltransferase
MAAPDAGPPPQRSTRPADQVRQTVGQALAWAGARLREAGSPSPRLDAEVLLAHLLERDRTWLLAHPEEPMGQPDAYGALIARRAAGEPVAYLRGFKEWRSLRIRTDARALIPRPETELLLEAAVEEIERRLVPAGAAVLAWDVATGSGAVAVALALRFAPQIRAGRLRLIASDLSEEALELAAENLAGHGVGELVELVRADLLEPAGGAVPAPDVVVANLPYVPSAEVDARRGSLGFEPRVALDGGPDGLAVLRSLLDSLPSRTAPSATVFLELGVDQVEAIRAMAPSGASVSVVPDLAGLDRVVRIGMAD